MNKNEIWKAIDQAIKADRKNQPNFPDHMAGMAGKVTAASGNLMVCCMDYKYNKNEEFTDEVYKQFIRDEAVKTAAMAIRFLQNLK